MNRVVSQPSLFFQYRDSTKMNGVGKRHWRNEVGDGSPSGKRIKFLMGSNPVIGERVVKALDGISNETQPGAEVAVGGKSLIELLPVEVWQRILGDEDDPKVFFDLFKASPEFRNIIGPRSLRFAVDFSHSSNAEEAMWNMVVQIGESCGFTIWNLDISFGDFSFDFYVHLMHCLSLMPNLRSLRLRLSPVGKLRTSKLIGPRSHGGYLDYSWKHDDMWQFIDDHQLPRLPQLTHLDLDVNEDTMDFLSAAIFPAYARQITKFETRILLCLRFSHNLMSIIGLKHVTELHLKQIQSLDEVEKVLEHLQHLKPTVNTLCLYLAKPLNVVDLLELVQGFPVKTLRVIESVKGGHLYELGPNYIRKDERVPILSTIENLEFKDSRHLNYEFLNDCSKLQCLTVLQHTSCRKFKSICPLRSDVGYQLRKCMYLKKPKNIKLWDMIPSLETLQIKSFDNKPLKTLGKK